jgi:cytochrome P450
MDGIRDLTIPFPVTVLSVILGVPKPDINLFKAWADGILAFQDMNNPHVAVLRLARTLILEIWVYLVELIKRKCRHEGDILLSELVAAELRG